MLTRRQAELLTFIDSYIRTNTFAPNYDEMLMAGTSPKSRSGNLDEEGRMAMVTMVERVARAIAPKAWKTAGLDYSYDPPANKNRRTASLRHARAAIAAMRDPPPELLSYAAQDNWSEGDFNFADAWNDVIDTALSPTVER